MPTIHRRRAGRGLPDQRRAGRRPALRRAAATDRPGAGHPPRPGDPDPRRGHQPDRPGKRAVDPPGPGGVRAGRTAILITHRLSTLTLADRIVVMDGGQILDQGTHTRNCCPVVACTGGCFRITFPRRRDATARLVATVCAPTTRQVCQPARFLRKGTSRIDVVNGSTLAQAPSFQETPQTDAFVPLFSPP